MKLSVIILSYNTKKLLENCLSSILRQTKGIDYEVIVVDNASSDGSIEVVEKLAKKNKRIKLIKNSKNLGFAAGNNVGIKKAKGEHFLLLNSDTLLKENAFQKLLEFVKKHPRLGVVGPRLLNKDGSRQLSAAPFFTLPNAFLWLFTGDRFLYFSPFKPRQVDWVMGSAFLIKKEAIKKAGLLDEKFFMYVEEQEWCYRIKKAGWQVWFYPGAQIYHLVRGSSPGGSPADWQGKQKAILWIFKGLIYFYQKHFAPWQQAVLKWLLRTKAVLAWALGLLTKNAYLKKTYRKAFLLAR